MIKLIQGDCLEKMKDIESGSVDMILTDPPYGMVKMKEKAGNYKVLNTAETWDKAIKPNEIFVIANRILRKNGKLILFSQEPYTTELITKSIPNIPFNYRMIWEKDNFANALSCNKAPVSYFEDVIVFQKHFESENNDDNPCKKHAISVFNFIGKSLKDLKEYYGNSNLSHFYSNGKQFRLCTEETYSNLITDFGIDKMGGFLDYQTLKKLNIEYKESFKSIFNLQKGKKYKSNILKYKKDSSRLHPTQKPVALVEDLIKTYTNENDTVLDFTMGSGTTGVACKNLNRNFIGIELDETYFKIAEERINKTQQKLL